MDKIHKRSFFRRMPNIEKETNNNEITGPPITKEEIMKSYPGLLSRIQKQTKRLGQTKFQQTFSNSLKKKE